MLKNQRENKNKMRARAPRRPNLKQQMKLTSKKTLLNKLSENPKMIRENKIIQESNKMTLESLLPMLKLLKIRNKTVKAVKRMSLKLFQRRNKKVHLKN